MKILNLKVEINTHREKWFEHLQKMEENTIPNILLQENSHSNI